MKHKFILAAVSILFVSITLAIVYYVANSSAALIDTKGLIAESQRDLMLFATILSLVILIPVYIMIFAIAWRYKEGSGAEYKPNWDSNKKLEIAWWGFPIFIIAILSVLTWQTSHTLDPYKPILSDKNITPVQVVSLQWRWLFIYPEQGIATINYTQFPVDRPVEFSISAESPMNTFWIPRLGGMIYAMNGMQTKLHLQANESGIFEGLSGNISGEGFAGMKFIAKASSDNEFNEWVTKASSTSQSLDWSTYKELSKASTDTKVQFYKLEDENLFSKIINQYMGHSSILNDKLMAKEQGEM
jgi:cytochrome o ubiquinol oxidase subunit II